MKYLILKRKNPSAEYKLYKVFRGKKAKERATISIKELYRNIFFKETDYNKYKLIEKAELITLYSNNKSYKVTIRGSDR